MKINIKKKDFEDKAILEKTLGTLLKKPVSALIKKTVEKLPFCYEVDYFSEGNGFISIGVAKEVDKLFKTKRAKGQGVDENGKSMKIDKKKVAFGNVSINAQGQVEFCVLGGMMKEMQAKKVIKSISILKKMIGDNFVIVKGEAPAPNEDTDTEDSGAAAPPGAAAPADSAQLQATIKKIIGAYKDFAKVDVANIKKDKSAKTFMAAWTKGSSVAKQLAEWIKEADGNADTEIELAMATKAQQTVQSVLNKLKPAIDKIKGAQSAQGAESKKSNVNLDTISSDISNKIQELLSGFGPEIDSIPGLKGLLSTIG
jgi:hypothetical protein